MFGVIKAAHIACVRKKRGDITRTVENVRANVTRQQVKIFLSRRENCQLEKSKKTKGVVIIPIVQVVSQPLVNCRQKPKTKCENCQLQKSKKTNGVVITPIISSHFNDP